MLDRRIDPPVAERFNWCRNVLGACFAFGVLLLSSCTGYNGQSSSDRMAAAVYQGILRPADATAMDSTEGQSFEIITAFLGDIVSDFGVPVGIHYTTHRHLYFDNNSGIFTLNVENGQLVRADDVLAHLSMENEIMEVDRVEAEWRLNRFNRSVANDQRWLDLENARNDLAIANDSNWRQQALRVAQLELRYERFRFDTENTRQDLQQALDDIDKILAGEYLRAPFDGMVLSVTRTPNNTTMEGRPRILTLVDENEFLFVINVDEHQFRTAAAAHARLIGYGDVLTVRSLALVEGGERPLLEFEARVVSDPWGAGQRDRLTYWLVPADREALIEKLYEIDPYAPMFALSALNFSSRLHVTLVDNGVLLPIAAVYPEDRRNFVYVYEDGRLSKRYVSTGIRFGGYVHIVSGLEPGVQVVVLP